MKSIVRTQKISIDKPFLGAEPWVGLILQAVQLDVDGNPSATTARTEPISKKGYDIFPEEVTIKNPYTQEEKTFTGLEVQLAIAAFSRKWILERAAEAGKNAYIDDYDNVIVEDY